MSETTIQVPAEHLEAIRQSLLGRRGDAGSTEEIERLLSQIARGTAGVTQSHALTGPRPLLWSAVYDSLCAAAEQLADDCNEYWRGAAAGSARSGVATVAVLLELLVTLGPPPGH